MTRERSSASWIEFERKECVENEDVENEVKRRENGCLNRVKKRNKRVNLKNPKNG